MYKTMKGGTVLRLSDGAVIPQAEDNRDYVEYLAWLADGGIPETDEKEQFELECLKARLERNAELSRADVQLNKVQDGVKGIGTVDAWRKYRIALRDWPTTEGFPTVFPTAPDIKE